MQAPNFLGQYYHAGPPPPHSQQPPQPGLGGYQPANASPFHPGSEIHLDGQGHLAGPPGPSNVQLPEPELPDPLGVGDDDDSTLDTPGGKKKGGRPRDKVWELFDGDREVAKCRYCQWKTDHPKAFRMRAHVATCELIPQDRREDLQRFQEEKEHRQAIKKEHAEQLGAAGGGAPPKKVKRDHNGDVVIGSAASRPKMVPAPPARSPITCHVLDSTSGKPAPEMRIRLDRLNTTGFVLQAQGMTDNDGRCSTLLPSSTRLEVGIFKITFFVNEYFTKRGILSFYPFIEIPFEVKSADEHYHIPCLLSPYSYTTYRGS
ncbi:hypothetical protein Rhopal_000319-T1 [Rhodotorula paludigena]|uniref:hydroxyisourate hydrolase n=1 Tax=Rhodotorula paludigena TaxID=86838 RepID=A0AAV5GC78_9BASI|nr:hypothetical protein Rhopal_000319-T1 [Rhodotorula paludigena]